MRLTLLYNNLRAVIPAPFYNGVNSSGNPGCLRPRRAYGPEGKDWIPDQVWNDKIVKSFLRHYTSFIISQQRTNEMAKKKQKIVKVFIVDDSAFLRDRLITMLSELKGIEIIGQAEGPTEAIEALTKLKPDAVILDIRMPGGNGIDVLKNIKKDRDSPLVIMFTNYPYPQYRKKCMDAGADFFFDKSTEFEKVTEVLKNLIKNP